MNKNGSSAEKHEGRLRAAQPVPKPWGREIRFANEVQYSGRILELRKGQEISSLKNDAQTRTVYLLSGVLWCHLNGMEFEMVAGTSLTLYPGDANLLHAVEESVILESGTPH
jgi:mannose-6-phosphate isomerase